MIELIRKKKPENSPFVEEDFVPEGGKKRKQGTNKKRKEVNKGD